MALTEPRTRRQVAKAAAYIAPGVLTLAAQPATARFGLDEASDSHSTGSARPGNET